MSLDTIAKFQLITEGKLQGRYAAATPDKDAADRIQRKLQAIGINTKMRTPEHGIFKDQYVFIITADELDMVDIDKKSRRATQAKKLAAAPASNGKPDDNTPLEFEEITLEPPAKPSSKATIEPNAKVKPRSPIGSGGAVGGNTVGGARGK